ncbi:membrane-associated progesterone receptor component 1 [Magnaporthiopsis poae ATCC 64411]|uniref:Membrane-associated progesterone receptor component 1 n=1 Tax=Magnaporthiopsis poae (strain ATCC 64411 / 73-15) TaxID=644358 RepID=A0A0C4E1B8_MAGP6|nr:membrane-associated progesterone receptor component 1 [Magnaporthiopsis poae ATCC 64411]
MDYVGARMAKEAHKAATEPAPSNGLITPLNLLILAVIGYTLYVLLRPSAPAVMPREAPPTVFRTFTPRTLLENNGENGKPVYLAFIREQHPEVFDEDMLTKDLDGPLDTLEGLGPDQLDALREWEERFDSKYLVVGRLVAVGDEKAKA